MLVIKELEELDKAWRYWQQREGGVVEEMNVDQTCCFGYKTIDVWNIDFFNIGSREHNQTKIFNKGLPLVYSFPNQSSMHVHNYRVAHAFYYNKLCHPSPKPYKPLTASNYIFYVYNIQTLFVNTQTIPCINFSKEEKEKV